MGSRWDRFRELATREERRGPFSAAYTGFAVVVAGAASALLVPAVGGKRVDVALLVPGILFALAFLWFAYLALAPLLHLWPHHPITPRPTEYRRKTKGGGYEPAPPPPSAADLLTQQDNIRESIDHTERQTCPNFSAEIHRFAVVDRDYDGSDEWVDVIDEWIEDVWQKLQDWNPRNAGRFLASPVVGDIGLIITAPLLGRSDLNDYPELRRLHAHRDRLREITGQ